MNNDVAVFSHFSHTENVRILQKRWCESPLKGTLKSPEQPSIS